MGTSLKTGIGPERMKTTKKPLALVLVAALYCLVPILYFSNAGASEKPSSISLDVQAELRSEFGPSAVSFYKKLDGTVPLMQVPSDGMESGFSRRDIYEWLKQKAVALNQEAIRLYTTVAPDQAVPYALKAKEITEKALGRDHPSIAKSLNFLAELYKLSGQHRKAVPFYKRTVEIYEKKHGRNHESVAKALDNLAQYYSKSGDLTRAEPIYMEILSIYKTIYGKDNSKVVSTTYNLAILNDTLGRFSKAEPLYRTAIASAEKVHGRDHPTVASGLNNLGLLLYSSGRFANAELLFRRALDIYKKAYGIKHPAVPTVMNNLALIYSAMGRYNDAEGLFRNALRVDEKIYGKDHINLLPDLNNLAELQRDRGNLSEAEPLFKRALAIGRMKLSDNNPAISTTLNNLAFIHYSKGELEKAEAMYLEAIDRGSKSLGALHPDVASWKSNLAILYASKGNITRSYKLFKEVMDVEYIKREDIFTLLSEKQRLEYIKRTGSAVSAYISLLSGSSTEGNRTDVFNTWLRWKGAVMETQQRYMDAVALSDDVRIRTMFDNLMKLRKKIATLILSGSGQMSSAVFETKLESFYEKEGKIEADLSRLSKRFALEKISGRASASNIASILPADSAYVDYAAIQSYDFDKRRKGQQKYYAFILLPGKTVDVNVVDLGLAENIDKMVASYLLEMRSPLIFGELPRKKILRKDSLALYSMLIEPLKGMLKGRKHLYISPDSNLNLIPFEVFTSPDGKYLIEDFQVSYITAGRDIMRFTSKVTANKTALIFADPDYDLKPPAPYAARETVDSAISDEFSAMSFVRLEDTATEADEISRILTEKYNYKVNTLKRENALEERLFEADSPRILHLATHAYFLKDDGGATNRDGDNKNVVALNPMHRSGILLAGANDSLRNGRDFGIVSAYKALGLNLLGTELVVLSACDTGTGEVQMGEGVFGLKRAFIIAGAKTLVMSLWSVPSAETTRLMINFYDSISQDRSKAGSLREAKLGMIADGYNPFFWGAFVLAGNPG
ncbi:MAG TPA: tetratricopeptide repeat protein [Nitrospirae bacterium]|nr:tetratricopeptide repeat protein [Nitrospirota bacterium]